MISDCTDPYQPLEKKYKITRKCVATLTKYNFPLLILTKSDLVTRDIDLLNETTVVALTITTLDEDVAKFIEPNAPSPLKRINCLEKISNHNIPIAARIDPIIPSINDDERDFEQLVSILADLGVTHITISTLKPVKGFFKNLRQLDPSLYIKLKNIYDEGVSILGYQYLPARVRYRIVQKFRSIVLKYKLNFSSCREGFPQLNTSICDGSEKCRKQTKLMGFLQ
jgi:DNA repair photolyase